MCSAHPAPHSHLRPTFPRGTERQPPARHGLGSYSRATHLSLAVALGPAACPNTPAGPPAPSTLPTVPRCPAPREHAPPTAGCPLAGSPASCLFSTRDSSPSRGRLCPLRPHLTCGLHSLPDAGAGTSLPEGPLTDAPTVRQAQGGRTGEAESAGFCRAPASLSPCLSRHRWPRRECPAESLLNPPSSTIYSHQRFPVRCNSAVTKEPTACALQGSVLEVPNEQESPEGVSWLFRQKPSSLASGRRSGSNSRGRPWARLPLPLPPGAPAPRCALPGKPPDCPASPRSPALRDPRQAPPCERCPAEGPGRSGPGTVPRAQLCCPDRGRSRGADRLPLEHPAGPRTGHLPGPRLRCGASG